MFTSLLVKGDTAGMIASAIELSMTAIALSPYQTMRSQGEPIGFAASIVKRGCNVVQIPTTLLAQVDGQRSAEEIVAHVLAERPGLLPSPQAIRDFVKHVLAQECTV